MWNLVLVYMYRNTKLSHTPASTRNNKPNKQKYANTKKNINSIIILEEDMLHLYQEHK